MAPTPEQDALFLAKTILRCWNTAHLAVERSYRRLVERKLRKRAMLRLQILSVHAGEDVKPLCRQQLSSDVLDAGKISADRTANFIAIRRYLVR
jgi:hypothetical protein